MTTPPPTIFIIEDDPLMAECIARAITKPQPSPTASISRPPEPPLIRHFSDAIAAANALSDELPDLVLLDILLNGPDGFTFLNEMISYSDTAKIPIIIITSLSIADADLAHYGVRAILDKGTMTPQDIQSAVHHVLHPASAAEPRRLPEVPNAR